MRDYDPTTGRYLQADPLGLVDGASVYGYVKGNPLRIVDPKGEWGIVGALLGAGGNAILQAIVNYNRYGLDLRILKCMDIKSIAVAGILGGFGVSPLSSGWGVVRHGAGRKFGQDMFITTYTQFFATVPVVLGDECCMENQNNLGLSGALSNFLGGMF
jgi:hypothetical protein